MGTTALEGEVYLGAFTWGVLDRLLEAVRDGEIEIDAISGTSAGAMNAAVATYGLMTGDAESTRKLLDNFWTSVSRRNLLSPLQEISTQLTGSPDLDNHPAFIWMEAWKNVLSPQQFNPMNKNPLRDLLNETIDFETFRELLSEEGGDRLFIGATNVSKGKPKVFHGDEISADAVMASATLPDTFHAVEIDGEYFWDGGYMVNPPLEALRFDDTDDIVLVQINPFARDEKPRTKKEIADAANKLMFNAALVGEIRAIEQLNHLFESGKLKPSAEVRPQRLHRIIDEDRLRDYGHTSKGNTSMSFLRDLKMLGRRAADQWLEEAAPHIGKKSTWEANWANPIEHLGRSKLIAETDADDALVNGGDRWAHLRGAATDAMNGTRRPPTVRLRGGKVEPVGDDGIPQQHQRRAPG
ncbi:MAG: patatin-like phospholipase family protein, partial [Pseudomonadota bacterium]